MKKGFLSLLFGIIMLCCMGQGVGKKGGSHEIPERAAPSLMHTSNKVSLSGTSQIEKGYVYILKKNSRIYYSISGNNMSTISKTISGRPTRIVYLQTNKTYQTDARGNLLINYTAPVIDHIDSVGIIQNSDKKYVETVITTAATNEIKVIPRSYRASIYQSDSGRLNVNLFVGLKQQKQLYSSKSAQGLKEEEATQLKINKAMEKFEKFAENTESLLENTVNSSKIDKKRAIVFAHRIYSDDSVQNFYLSVLANPTLGIPVYFLSIPYRVWQVGAVTIPFKYRFGYNKTLNNVLDSVPGDATANINVAAYFGRKWGRTRFYYDESKSHNTFSYMASAFAGPAIINLTEDNTFIKPTGTSALAVSVGLALSAEIKTLNFGFFSGRIMH